MADQKKRMNKRIANYIWLIIGAAIQGIGMSLFLFPHSIPSGGAAGLAILLNHFFNIQLGFGLWVSNAVFLIFALQYFGFNWTFKTIISVAITSTTVSILTPNIVFPHIHILIDLLFGAVLFGIGVGFLIRVGSSSGGMVIPALMIANWKNLNPGQVMLIINLFIFLLTSMIINYKIVIFAVICQFISTRIIDTIYGLHLGSFKMLTLAWRKEK